MDIGDLDSYRRRSFGNSRFGIRWKAGRPLPERCQQLTGTTNTGALFSGWGTTTLNALGRSSSDTVPGFNGAVDEVLVACRAYTDDEIKQLAYLPPN